MQELAASPALAAGSSARRRFAAFAWGVLAYNIAVILWGALVRATSSGAGCGGHWPLCNGDFLPQAPGVATVVELTHRVMSGVALIAVAVQFAWAWRAYPRRHPVRRWAGWSLGFIVSEALLGAALVLLGHVAGNESVGRVYSLSAHLINTFLLLASLALTAWWASAASLPLATPRKARSQSFALAAPLVAIVIVAIAGAITALGDTLFPAHTLAEGVRDDFASTASFLVRLRVIHPALAAAAALYLGLVTVRSRIRPLATAILVLLALEVLVGGANILLKAPLALQLIHLLIADCLWIALVLFTSERQSGPVR